MAIYEYFQIRYNSANGLLELNTGNETWVPLDLTNNVTFPTITAANIDSGAADAGQLLTADGTGGATWEDPA